MERYRQVIYCALASILCVVCIFSLRYILGAEERLFEYLRRNQSDAFLAEIHPGVANKPVFPSSPGDYTYLIHCACVFQREDCVESLLNNGADPSLLDYRGYTAMHCAIGGGDSASLAVKILALLYENRDAEPDEIDALITYSQEIGVDESVRDFLRAIKAR